MVYIYNRNFIFFSTKGACSCNWIEEQINAKKLKLTLLIYQRFLIITRATKRKSTLQRLTYTRRQSFGLLSNPRRTRDPLLESDAWRRRRLTKQQSAICSLSAIFFFCSLLPISARVERFDADKRSRMGNAACTYTIYIHTKSPIGLPYCFRPLHIRELVNKSLRYCVVVRIIFFLRFMCWLNFWGGLISNCWGRVIWLSEIFSSKIYKNILM